MDNHSPVTAVTRSMLEEGRIGLVLLDAERMVMASEGVLVGWVSPGHAATEAMPFLTGLDEVLAEISAGRRSSLRLPRVGWAANTSGGKVWSVEIMPAEHPNCLQILISDETEVARLEQELLQQRNELALLNDELQQAKERAESALRDKASFLANISHDLKTPLQVIMGNAEILQDDLEKNERDGFLKDVLDNSRFLLALINDLLEASALDAGQLALDEEPVDVRLLLERVITMAGQAPCEGKRRFELAMDDTDHVILADSLRLQRLLLNVVSNAVRFTGDGGHIRVQAGRGEDGKLNVEVEDDGCGIQPDMLDRIFEPFIKGGVSEGSGLGLHIAKALADLHGADLHLASVPGNGTTITLSIPKERVLD